MSTEENKATLKKVFEAANQRDFSAFDEIFSDEFVYRATSGEEAHGPEAMKDFVTTYHDAFADFHLTINEILAEGDKVATIYTQTGTHQGELLGIEPSGKQMELPIFSLVTFKDGKIAEIYDVFDTLDLMRQLGAAEDVQQVQAGGAERRYDGGAPQPGV